MLKLYFPHCHKKVGFSNSVSFYLTHYFHRRFYTIKNMRIGTMFLFNRYFNMLTMYQALFKQDLYK